MSMLISNAYSFQVWLVHIWDEGVTMHNSIKKHLTQSEESVWRYFKLSLNRSSEEWHDGFWSGLSSASSGMRLRLIDLNLHQGTALKFASYPYLHAYLTNHYMEAPERQYLRRSSPTHDPDHKRPMVNGNTLGQQAKRWIKAIDTGWFLFPSTSFLMQLRSDIFFFLEGRSPSLLYPKIVETWSSAF